MLVFLEMIKVPTSSEGNFPGPSNAFAQDTAHCHTQTKVPKVVLYLMCYELPHPSIGCLVALRIRY